MNNIQITTNALKQKGYEVFEVADKKEALQKVKNLIPKRASIMNGSSVTLEEIGFIDYLKSKEHEWNNLHEKVLAKEIDRKTTTISDFYLGSVHALTQDGQMIIASNTGSQLPSLTFNSQNIILVIGKQKIVKNLEEGLKRLEDYVYPLEDKHMMGLYGVGSQISKILIFRNEAKMLGRKINIILVDEKLGF